MQRYPKLSALNVLICVVLLCCSNISYAQITVNDTQYTPTELVNDVLINSTCTTISNVTFSTGTTEGYNGIGYFEKNGSDFEFENGIILSTGNATSAPGPNSIDGSGTLDEGVSTTWAGDTELETIVGIPLASTNNATVLEFDFTPTTNRMSFDFIMASEEYYDGYECEYSDAFAFLLKPAGTTDPYTNLAVLPNTSTPILVSNIHPVVTTGTILCDAQNEAYFDKYNIGTNAANSATNFNGQTKVMTAQSAVTPNITYHIKLVIADQGIGDLDSAIFLKGGSFSFGGDLGEDRTIANGNPGCAGTPIILDAGAIAGATYQWFRNDVELTTETTETLNVTTDGTYRATITIGGSCILDLDQVVIEFTTPPIIENDPIDILICELDNDNTEEFDFTKNQQLVLGTQNSNQFITSFHTSQADADANTNPIKSPYTNTSISEEIFIRMADATQTCFITTSFIISVDSEAVSYSEEIYKICVDDDGNAITPLPELDTNLDPSLFSFEWFFGEVSAENLIPTATSSSYTADKEGIYSVYINDLTKGCNSTQSTEVVSSNPPSNFTVNERTEVFASNNVFEAKIDGTGTYEYSLDGNDFQTAFVFRNLEAGNHILMARDTQGCWEDSITFTVFTYPKFFTPNADSYNNTWNLSGIANLDKISIAIYNRYGKLLKQFNPKNDYWDGTYNGTPLPPSDYWFTIEFTQNGVQNSAKGHFTLKR